MQSLHPSSPRDDRAIDDVVQPQQDLLLLTSVNQSMVQEFSGPEVFFD